MKKIFFMAFATTFAALALSTAVEAAVTCGVPGTEGLPTCSATSKPGEACCVPPYYKGVKTVAKSGGKTQAQPKIDHATIAPQALNATVTTTVTPSAPADYTPAPIPVVPSATASVSATASATSAPAAMASAPSAPSTPAAPAATATSGSAGKGAKVSK